MNANARGLFMKSVNVQVLLAVTVCCTNALLLRGATPPSAASNVHQTSDQRVASGAAVDRLGNVLSRPNADSQNPDSTGKGKPHVPTTFGFVLGHYYTSNYFASTITEYDNAGTIVGSYTLPPPYNDTR